MGTIENPQEEEVIKIERLIEDIENHPEDKVERILVTRNIVFPQIKNMCFPG